MSDRIQGDPTVLEALADELLATLPTLTAATREYQEALAAFCVAEPNSLGGPQLADLGAELDTIYWDLERLDVVPRTFARGLLAADRFAYEAGGAVWDRAADRFTDPLWVGGNLVGFGLGAPAALGKWATAPNTHIDGRTLKPIGPARVWDDARLERLPGRADTWYKWGRRAGRGVSVAGFALAGTSRYLQDRNDPTLTIGDRVARTGGAMATEGVGGLAGGAAGAKIGAGLGIAGGPLGMAAGAVIGGVIGGAIGSGAGGMLFDATEGVWDSMGDGLDGLGAWGSDVASDAALVDSALERGGEMLDSANDALSSAGDALSGLFG